MCAASTRKQCNASYRTTHSVLSNHHPPHFATFSATHHLVLIRNRTDGTRFRFCTIAHTQNARINGAPDSVPWHCSLVHLDVLTAQIPFHITHSRLRLVVFVMLCVVVAAASARMLWSLAVSPPVRSIYKYIGTATFTVHFCPRHTSDTRRSTRRPSESVRYARHERPHIH